MKCKGTISLLLQYPRRGVVSLAPRMLALGETRVCEVSLAPGMLAVLLLAVGAAAAAPPGPPPPPPPRFTHTHTPRARPR